MAETGTPSQVRELRLALVCYGGVSLAIYMHGVTKEIQKLVEASAALERLGGDVNPFAPDDSAHAYWDLLRRLRDGEVESPSDVKGLTLRVVVDVVSGTSAGGINGVCLAKTLAGNRSQDALRDLWMDRGDIAKLLRAPAWLPWWRLKAGWVAMRTVLSLGKGRAALDGDAMCGWLWEAFETMDGTVAVPGLPSLLPPGHELELFVTLTDFHGYERRIPLSDGQVVTDAMHRHLMVFRHCEPEGGTLGLPHNHALAFAARGTSSFPAAFDPISLEGYRTAVKADVDVEAIEREFFPQYRLAGTRAARTQFFDGGVLDNAPFASSIAAIGRRPAVAEVDRRLVYIEPDPSLPGTGGDEAPLPRPGMRSAALAGYASIPRKEPILDDLHRLYERNADVLRVRDVIESNFENVSAEVGTLLTGAAASMEQRAGAADLVRFRQQVEARAKEHVRAGHRGYLRVRVRSVVDSFAEAVSRALGWPADSNQARFVLAALRQWAGEGGLLSQAPGGATSEAQERFLEAFDVGYHERRLRLLVDAVNWWYRDVGRPGHPSREELGAAKETLYRHAETLRRLVVGLRDDAGLVADLQKAFPEDEVSEARGDDAAELSQFVARQASLLEAARDRVGAVLGEALPSVEEELHGDILDFTAGWSAEVRGAFMTRYVGFPIWDALVFPIQAMSRVGERDHVEVYRVSPRDVSLLGPPDPTKLHGMKLHHFGAFFDRSGRERDYLWGRIDAAERLVRLLLDCRPDPSTVPGRRPQRAELDRALLAREAKPVFAAVLAGERPHLGKAADLVDDLAARVEALS